MPKKTGAFIEFLMEWMDRQPRRMKIADAVPETREIWDGMSEAERQPYKDRSARRNGNDAQYKDNNSEPEPQPQKTKSSKEERRLIKFVVKDSIKNAKITRQRYVFIMQNSQQKGAKPTEIALMAYSYEEGIASTYHARIDQGERDERVDPYHFAKILARPKKNFQVYTEILKFVHRVDHDECFFVYTKRADIPVVQDAVDSLREAKPNADCLRVLPVEYLCFQIKEALCTQNNMTQPLYYEIENLFETKAKHTKETCFYHQVTRDTQSCVLPELKRWATIATQWLRGATVSGDTAAMGAETM